MSTQDGFQEIDYDEVSLDEIKDSLRDVRHATTRVESSIDRISEQPGRRSSPHDMLTEALADLGKAESMLEAAVSIHPDSEVDQ